MSPWWVLLALSSEAIAGGHVEGHVFTAGTGAPLADVSVTVDGSTVQTDRTGRFTIPVDAGDRTVQVVPGDGLQGGSVVVRVSDDGVTEVLVTVSRADPAGFLVEQPDVATVRAEAAAVVELEGRIVSTDGRPLPDVRVFARGVEGLGRTDENGRFVLEVPPGPQVLAAVGSGYTSLEEPVEVGPEGGSVTLTLQEAPKALAAFTISAPYLEGSVAGLLDDRKEGSTVADVLGADEMSRAGDSDAASALSRVTGLTVVDGKYVYVRGLGDRYSSSLLNNGMLPSPEPERRVVPLDLFPTSVLSGVVVQKTWTPDMPGEFGGGVVKLETIEPPTQWVTSVGLSGAYRHGTTFQRGLTTPDGSATDFFGLDAGDRAIPDALAQASSDQSVKAGDLFSDRGFSAAELEAFGESLDGQYTPVERVLPPDFGLNAAIGNGFAQDDVEGGVIGAFTFGNSWQIERFDRTYYTVRGDTIGPQHRYAFDQATNDISFGGFLAGGLDFGKTSIRYTGMLSRSSEDVARVYEGYNDDVGQDIRITRTRWVERQLFWNQVHGTHDLGKLDIEWHGIYAGASRLEPDRKETRFDNEPGTDIWLLSDRPEGNQRFFSDAGESTGEGVLDLTYRPFETEDRPGITFKFGGRVSYRARRVDTRRYKYFHRGPASGDSDVLAGTPEEIFTADHIGPEGFVFEEFTQPTDNYTARQAIYAAYAMADVPVTPWLSVLGGLRVEKADQFVETFALFTADLEPVPAELPDKIDVLPAATVTLAPTEDVRVRLGGARTVSRPEFREMSPATFNDVTGGRQTFGNPDIRPARIDHVDLRFEWFFASGELVSLGGFYKYFDAPIETVVVPSAQQSVTWQNAESAISRGLEIEVRKSLPANFWTAGNVSLIESGVALGENAGVQTSNERALQGQSPWVVNLQGGWEHPDRGDRVTVLFNNIGRRISEVGSNGAPDIYELPVPDLQVVGRKDLGSGFAASVKLSNLLDSPRRTVQGEDAVDSILRGFSVGVGLAWSAE